MQLPYDIVIERFSSIYEKSVLKRYEKSQDDEINEVIEYVKKNGLRIFNYDFVSEYEKIPIIPIYDNECQLYYVWHKNKRMYYTRYLDTIDKVQKYYN